MKDTCNVTNKSSGHVLYTVPEMNIRRQFNPRETKKGISTKELEMVCQQPGGKRLVYNYLLVDDAEILTHILNGVPEKEYWLREEDIPHWMESCSLPEFQDALDFAPDGTKDLIKKYAVSMPLNDFSKRKAIQDQLGFDVSKAVEMTADDTKEDKPATPKRRIGAETVAKTEEEKPARRVVKNEG